MSSETTGEQQPPERPVRSDEPSQSDGEQRRDALAAISTEPGARYTENVSMLVIEAELAAEGTVLDNPAKIPEYADGAAERFAEALENHDDDLVPAWTRPWEGDE